MDGTRAQRYASSSPRSDILISDDAAERRPLAPIGAVWRRPLAPGPKYRPLATDIWSAVGDRPLVGRWRPSFGRPLATRAVGIVQTMHWAGALNWWGKIRVNAGICLQGRYQSASAGARCIVARTENPSGAGPACGLPDRHQGPPGAQGGPGRNVFPVPWGSRGSGPLGHREV